MDEQFEHLQVACGRRQVDGSLLSLGGGTTRLGQDVRETGNGTTLHDSRSGYYAVFMHAEF